jgi:hypothetical protein
LKKKNLKKKILKKLFETDVFFEKCNSEIPNLEEILFFIFLLLNLLYYILFLTTLLKKKFPSEKKNDFGI